MQKGPKIIQISGVRGILLTIFITTCLTAGFVVFPAKVAQCIWNYVATTYIAIPQINLIQGTLLWAMTALSIYLLNNRKFAISFQRPMELSDDEMKVLMDRIRMQKQAQKLNAMILKSNDIKIIKKDIEINKDNITTDSNENSDNANENKL